MKNSTQDYDLRMRRLLVLLVLAVPVLAQESRLATLAKIWGTARYAHPALGYRNIDWDAAAVKAIERTRAATSDDAFADAVDEMLSALGDELSRVEPRCVQMGIPTTPRQVRLIGNGVLYVPSEAPVDDALKNQLRAAHTAIVDLRAPFGQCYAPPLSAEVLALLFKGSVTAPDVRRVKHSGYRSQEPDFDSTTYTTAYDVEDGSTFTAAPDASVTRAIFVVDEHSQLPPIASRIGTILSAGRFHARSLIEHRTFDFGGRYVAYVRTSELLDDELRIAEPRVSTLPADASDDAIIAAALETPRTATRRRSAGVSSTPLPATYNWKYDETYRAMYYPPLEYRVLAAFRLWNIIDLFYGYKHLIGDWNAQLEPLLTSMIDAASQRDYDLALAKAMTNVPDGHSWVYSPSFLDLRGRAAAPFLLMPVEGKPVVVEIRHQIATDAGVAVGDELVSIDDRPVAERIAELKEYISASTEAAKEYYATSAAPSGPSGSSPRYTFRKPNGTTYSATLARGSYPVPDPAKPWRMLPGNIGYVDLRFLLVSQIGQMFSELSLSRGIIFDIRSYPRNVFPALGRAMNTTGSSVISQIRIPEVTGGVEGETLVNQDIGKTTTLYTGRTLALIDERAQSQSEHTCLTLEAVAGTKFVGSPTVGANGNVTFMVLPGSIYIMFTGMDVRHADGRQLQRVGVLPDYPVPRTQAALAAGTDEVLQKALDILRQ